MRYGDILLSLMLTHREQASRFIGELLQEPSACRHGMPHRVAIPDSSNAVLYSQSDSTTRGYLYPDTDPVGTGKPVLELVVLLLIRRLGFSTGKPVLVWVLLLLINGLGFSTVRGLSPPVPHKLTAC